MSSRPVPRKGPGSRSRGAEMALAPTEPPTPAPPPRRRRRWRLLLPLALLVGGLVWWFWPSGEPPGTGEELFHRRGLGSPLETGIPYALALAMRDRYPEILG